MAPERTCVVTREIRDPEDLLRLVAGPDGMIWPDVRGKMPGRGAWLTISRDAFAGLDRMKGKVEHQLGAKLDPVAFRAALKETALRGVRDGLGMAARVGAVVIGADALDRELRAHKIAWLVTAADASERTLKAIVEASEGGDPVPVVATPWSTAELGGSIGRGLAAALGVPPARINQGLQRLLRLLDALG